MTPALRKIHRRTWRVFSILLPGLILVGLGVRPTQLPDEIPGNRMASLVDPRQIGRKENVTVFWGQDTDSLWYIAIHIDKNFEAASAIAILESENQSELLLGKLNHSGLTLFPLAISQTATSGALRIEDVIRKKNLLVIPIQFNQ